MTLRNKIIFDVLKAGVQSTAWLLNYSVWYQVLPNQRNLQRIVFVVIIIISSQKWINVLCCRIMHWCQFLNKSISKMEINSTAFNFAFSPVLSLDFFRCFTWYATCPLKYCTSVDNILDLSVAPKVFVVCLTNCWQHFQGEI